MAGFGGVLQRLISSNNLVGFWNFKSGSFYDYSGNSNAASPTSVVWQGNNAGLDLSNANAVITVTDDASLQLTSGCLVVFGNFVRQEADRVLINKADGGGTNWQWYINATPQIVFHDGVNARTIAQDIVGTKFHAVNFESGGTPEGYVDGLSIGNYDNTVTVTTDDADVYIGNDSGGGNNINNILHGALIINRILTNSEISELYSQLENLVFSSSPKLTAAASLGANPAEPGLVFATNMKPVGSVVPDLSENGHNGTVHGALSGKSLLGEKLIFDGTDDYVDCGNVGTIKTVALWLKSTTTTEDIMDLDGGTHTVEVNAGTLTATGFDTPTIYVDGAATTALSANLPQYVVITTATGFAASAVKIGMETTYFDGEIYDVEFFDDVKSLVWIKNKYLQGAIANQISTSFASLDTVSFITDGQITNTPIFVNSGWWDIITQEVTCNGFTKLCKVLKCSDMGLCYIPTPYFGVGTSSAEAAYGHWQMWIYHGKSLVSIGFVSQDISVVANGYGLYLDGVIDDAYIAEWGIGGIINMGECNSMKWNKFDITRQANGDFECFINDVLRGTGNDTTITDSNYICISMQGGDKLVLGSLDSQWSFRKFLGVTL